MIPIDEKIKEICERRKFISFWEAFDYMKLANYSELEAIMIALQLFNGKIWDKVVFTKKLSNNNNNGGSVSGVSSLRILSSGTVREDNRGSEINDNFEVDNMNVKIFIMTEEADAIYLPVYKAYAETREYAPNLMLENHIKIITTSLTTELGIQLFNDWYNTQ